MSRLEMGRGVTSITKVSLLCFISAPTSISSNYEDSVTHFLRIIRLLCKLYTKPDENPRNRMDSCSSVASRRSRVDSASNMFKAAFGTRPSGSGSGSPIIESEGTCVPYCNSNNIPEKITRF